MSVISYNLSLINSPLYRDLQQTVIRILEGVGLDPRKILVDEPITSTEQRGKRFWRLANSTYMNSSPSSQSGSPPPSSGNRISKSGGNAYFNAPE